MEALANFMTAKKKLAQVRQTSQRGFAGRGGRGSSSGGSSSSAKGGSKGKSAGGDTLAAKKAKSRCADCGQYGHWHGDPECSKVQTGAVPKHRPPQHGAHMADIAEYYAPPAMPNTPYPEDDPEEWEDLFQDANVLSAAAAAQPTEAVAQPQRAAAKPKAKAAPKATAAAAAKAAPAAKAASAASAAATPAEQPYLGPGAKPPTPEQERCPHPRSSQKDHKNQHAFWTRCDRCSLRLSYQPAAPAR